ncbi:MAG: polynucleotide adenylyltransferase PcnB [Gammaproteobacteria bacterium]|nr:polynucleotide adenylyltransferase PcnB [Gammaproteobacteria bacterium]
MASTKPAVVTLDDFARDSIPAPLSEIHRRLRKGGHDAFLVGGCIRDYLLGLIPKDFDTATDAKPEKIRKLLPRAFIIGRRFRLVHARRGETTYEIATYRKEPPSIKSPKRGRGISPENTYGNQREDAFRRDFTINALYLDLRRKEVIDYVGGLRDLQDRVIRSIGPPDDRFQEDPVRMLRAARFAAKLNFSLDPEVKTAIHTNKHLLDHVSRPRMKDELTKLFLTGHGVASYQAMVDLDLFASVFPQHKSADSMIKQAMIESDERYASGHKLSAAYLFAVMLWHFYKERLHSLELEHKTNMNVGELRQHACYDVLQMTRQYVALNREVQQFILSVFALQNRLEKKSNVRRTLSHPLIRAAVHLLDLRAKVGEVDPSVVTWWKQRQPARTADRSRKRKSNRDYRRSRYDKRRLRVEKG